MSVIIYAIDPGTEKSALVTFNDWLEVDGFIMSNEGLLVTLRSKAFRQVPAILAIERIEARGMAVGETTFETVHWAGRFMEAWETATGGLPVNRITRRTIKVHLCGDTKAKDPNIRQALIDRFGGSDAIRKAKKCPSTRKDGHEACPRCAGTGLLSSAGPLAGITSHMWAALAVAVTCADTLNNREEK